ncbi:aldo/keto reductase [Phenylobacterium sp.]|uniref:aldo/keto reductase n=1 Tax=Phenylobacterium sp. TaxID=1871053 RepID=UPI0028A08913|nr:aldo/keto reductase [Phenylobacterium sp.]
MPQPLITFNDGATLPQLGLGVWQVPDDEAAAIVQAAVEAGYRHVDTAAVYKNETGVGAGLARADAGAEVAVTTKLWNESQGYDRALKAFDKSLQRLGRDSVDLYLIHWPCPAQDLYVESWKALVRLKEEGRAKSIGVSNFAADHLRRIVGETGVTPAVNQIELHPRFQQTALRAVHAELGIVTECWSPLGQGKLLQDPVIGKVAAKHGKTPAQTVIRWHLDNGFLVIPKSANADRIRQNFDVFDFTLDAEDMAAIAGLDAADGRIGPDPLSFG